MFSTILGGAATLQYGLDRVKGERGRQYRRLVHRMIVVRAAIKYSVMSPPSRSG
jgi:hypothetical protein